MTSSRPLDTSLALSDQDIALLIATLRKALPAITAHRSDPKRRGHMVGFRQFFGSDEAANYRLQSESTIAMYELDFKLWPKFRNALLNAALERNALQAEIADAWKLLFMAGLVPDRFSTISEGIAWAMGTLKSQKAASDG